MARTDPVMSLGSTSRLATKRSGCSASARSATSPVTPTRPMATPWRSISPSVTCTGSSPWSRWLGTSLNMYSAGNAMPWLCWSRSWGAKNSYWRRASALGKPIMRSTTPMSVGMGMARP